MGYVDDFIIVCSDADAELIASVFDDLVESWGLLISKKKLAEEGSFSHLVSFQSLACSSGIHGSNHEASTFCP